MVLRLHPGNARLGSGMRNLFICGLFALHGVIQADYASAKTLIVTHPEKEFDKQSTAAPASRTLLLNQVFDRKILILTPPTDERDVTFSLEGLTYELIRSPDGVFSWQSDDTEITLSGGYATACMFGSLLSVVQTSQSNLQFTLPMDAIYAMQLSFIFGSQDPELTKNLAQWKAHFDAKTFEEFLEDYGNYLLEKIPFQHGSKTASGRQSSEYKISIQLKGREISSHGTGAQRIQINFL